MAQAPESSGCPLCGGASRRRLVTKRGYDVVRCAECRLVYVWPQPTREELEAIYSAGGYHAEIDEGERRRTFARRLRQIEELAPRRGRVLDVGCSKGTFLETARDEGWDAVGVELNRNAAEEARARGLDVRHGDLGSQGFVDASFDVITLYDLIEHTPEPKATLRACHRLLRPGGLLVITTPNIGGLVPRVTYALFATTLGAWDHPTPPGHLVQFSRRTLQQMLAESDFRVARWRAEHIPMAYSVGKLENSIMDVLAGRHRTKPVPKAVSDKDAGGAREGEAPAEPRCRSRSGSAGASPSLARLAVRGLAWLVVGSFGLMARATGWGDSMLVLAGRAE